jgi:hypothetical protein
MTLKDISDEQLAEEAKKTDNYEAAVSAKRIAEELEALKNDNPSAFSDLVSRVAEGSQGMPEADTEKVINSIIEQYPKLADDSVDVVDL